MKSTYINDICKKLLFRLFFDITAAGGDKNPTRREKKKEQTINKLLLVTVVSMSVFPLKGYKNL